MKKKTKNRKIKQRRWYAVFLEGSCDVDCLISARSKFAVERFMKKLDVKCKIILARSWTLAQVFSGGPYKFPKPDTYAANKWDMAYKYEDSGHSFENVVHVAILD
jgi:hypothetical protein